MAICGAEDVTEWGESLPRPAYTQELEEGVHTGDELLPGFLRRGQRLLYRSLEQAVQGRTVEDPQLPGWADPRGRCGTHELFHTAKRVACVPEPLYCYRLREGQHLPHRPDPRPL